MRVAADLGQGAGDLVAAPVLAEALAGPDGVLGEQRPEDGRVVVAVRPRA
jgi:hypothetical protein